MKARPASLGGPRVRDKLPLPAVRRHVMTTPELEHAARHLDGAACDREDRGGPRRGVVPTVEVEVDQDGSTVVATPVPDVDRVLQPASIGADQRKVEQGPAELLPPPEALQGTTVPGLHGIKQGDGQDVLLLVAVRSLP